MKRIGIIGAENSHTAAIAKTINIDKKIPGFVVEYVWGETEQFAKAAAEKGSIPTIVEKPSEMKGKIDAIIIDHRHPKYHLAAARPFLGEGIPIFIDKPFCYRLDKGKAFLAEARKAKTPIASFSVLPHQKTFQNFKKKLDQAETIVSAGTAGPCDLKSPNGGVFFYGIHQVDMVLVAFGYDVEAVRMTCNGENNATGQLLYQDGKIVTMDLIKAGAPGFGIHAVTNDGVISKSIKMDANMYLGGIRTFIKMFRTGKEPVTAEQMLRPVAVLEALQKSQKSGKTERVAR
jgi:predicted dehydrogenase